jgi:hypothetical protein
MGGVRIGGAAALPAPPPGIPYTVFSVSDFLYLAQNLVEVSDKTVDSFDEGNNALLSPNNQWIVLNANFPPAAPNFEGEIFVEASSAVAGSPAPFVVSGPDVNGGWALHPSWHPDSDHILYVRGNASGSFQGDIIEIQRSNPGVETTIYSNPDSSGATGWGVFRPQYNRDGTKVAWLRHKNAAPADGLNGLYVADADGTGLTQIDDMGGGAASGYLFEGSQFQWGPNDEIVYIRYMDNTATGAQIYLIQADGTGMTQLSTDADTSTQRCRVSNRCFSPADDFILASAQTSKSFGGSWDLWRLELDGSGGTWLDLGIHGIDGSSNFQCVYVHDGRVYMIESDSGGRMISCLPDGTDIVTNVDLGTNMDGTQFFPGSGIEWN